MTSCEVTTAKVRPPRTWGDRSSPCYLVGFLPKIAATAARTAFASTSQSGWRAFCAEVALPCSVLGPVDFSHGLFSRMISAWRARRSTVQALFVPITGLAIQFVSSITRTINTHHTCSFGTFAACDCPATYSNSHELRLRGLQTDDIRRTV